MRRSNLPEWMLGPNDLGQIMVLVLRRKPTENENSDERSQDTPLPDSIIVGTSIELKVGVKEARTIIASREGRGSRYLLRTSSKTLFDKLTKITELTDGTEVEIVPHPTLNTVQGVVYDPDTINKDEQSILDYLKPQGVHAVRRIKKRVKGILQNTPLLVLSFHGTVVPNHVYFGLLRTQVRVYYPSPMICFNCGFYGHSKKFCKQPGICLRCSATHDVPEGEECVNPINCLHCKKGHQVTSRDCPKYKQEEKIVRLKVDKGMSFAEARRIYTEETRQETFAAVVQEQIQQQMAAKDQLIATLQKQVAALAKELASLKNVLKSRSHSQSLSQSEHSPSSNSQTLLPKTTPSTPAQQNIPSQSNRLSRKDQTFISPPGNQKENRRAKKQEYDVQTRSRSNKRHMEISPTETVNHRGKRTAATSHTTNKANDTEKNNGPGPS